MVSQSLVLRINICDENRHLRQSRKRYAACATRTTKHFVGTKANSNPVAKHSDKSWCKLVFGKRTLFWSTIILVALGFAFNFNYQRQSGCFVEDELMLSPTKFIFSISSLLLLSSGILFFGQ